MATRASSSGSSAATFWTQYVAIQYARGAGFAVEGSTTDAVADRSDMPDTHFVLRKNNEGRWFWFRRDA